MSDVAAPLSAASEAIYPPKISLHEIWPWALLGFVLLLMAFFVGIDGGAASLASGNSIHEFLHDGRHLLGFPCH